jgi:hypothetical protein
MPFLVEEFNGAMLKMLMGRNKIPFTWRPEIRMDELAYGWTLLERLQWYNQRAINLSLSFIEKLLSFDQICNSDKVIVPCMATSSENNQFTNLVSSFTFSGRAD